MLLVTAVSYLVNLTVSGYANVYYSAAAWAASQSWSAWFFGSVDPSNFITVDKPPLATMVLGLSVRIFGLSSASILVPQALMGIATVAILMAIVRRTFGPAASIIAGLVMALTPAAVLIFRYDNPDALLTLLLVGAAYALLHGMERDRLRWIALSGILVGFAFETKLLQAYLVLPAFAVTFAVAAPGSIRRRVAGLAIALSAVLISSSWWIAAIELIPSAARPYIGGSTDNSALDLVLGYDGLGRIFGQAGPGGAAAGGGAGAGGAGFSGTPGVLRLFNDQLGGQVAWFLPMAVIGLVSGLVARFRAPRTDIARAAYLMWGLWLLVHAVVFSFMSGVIHSYYVVAMAPAIAALVGGGLATLWQYRARVPVARAIFGLSILASAGLAWLLLARTPSFVPWLVPAILIGGVIGVLFLLLPARLGFGRLQLGGAVLGVLVLLAGPAAYAADTVQTAYAGGDPAAGPAIAAAAGPGSLRGVIANVGRGGGLGGPGGQPPAGAVPGGPPPDGGQGLPGGAVNPGGAGGGPGGLGVDSATLDYLVANQGSARWIVAVTGADTAGQIELQTSRAVMAMGGFTGSDDAPTLAQLQALTASGELRFVLVAGSGGPGGGSSALSDWVTATCTPVVVNGSTTSVYDCAGSVSA